MNKSKILIAGAAFALAAGLVSCKEKDEIEDNPLVRFSAGIEKPATVEPGARVTGNSWGDGDAVGIFMMEGSTVTGTNKRYIITNPSAGTLEADGPNEQLYFPLTEAKVDFIAYYPYRSGASLDTPISIEVATIQTAANQPDYDLLWSDNATGYSISNAGVVSLEFRHKLSKLVMDCKTAANLGVSLDGMKVTVNGMNTPTTFDLSSGTLGTPGNVADITPRTLTDGKEYDAIILPGIYAAGAVTVDFTVKPGTAEEETFTWNVGDENFEGGYEYQYEVTLSRTGIKATATIKPWTVTDRGPVTAE